jgi:hypothetical protein
MFIVFKAFSRLAADVRVPFNFASAGISLLKRRNSFSQSRLVLKISSSCHLSFSAICARVFCSVEMVLLQFIVNGTFLNPGIYK